MKKREEKEKGKDKNLPLVWIKKLEKYIVMTSESIRVEIKLRRNVTDSRKGMRKKKEVRKQSSLPH